MIYFASHYNLDIDLDDLHNEHAILTRYINTSITNSVNNRPNIILLTDLTICEQHIAQAELRQLATD